VQPHLVELPGESAVFYVQSSVIGPQPRTMNKTEDIHDESRLVFGPAVCNVYVVNRNDWSQWAVHRCSNPSGFEPRNRSERLWLDGPIVALRLTDGSQTRKGSTWSSEQEAHRSSMAMIYSQYVAQVGAVRCSRTDRDWSGSSILFDNRQTSAGDVSALGKLGVQFGGLQIMQMRSTVSPQF